MSCPFCASDNPSQAQFCRACGAELSRLSASGASTDALPIGALLMGTYAVESVLGQGGFGITYCCHDQMLDRQVAVKEFFPAGCRRQDAVVQPSRGLSDSHFSEARAQFLAEARLLARCHHAGIVGVHTAFEANSTAYMVMELLHGSHLAQLLDSRCGRLSEAEAIPLIERVGEALQFVHDKGLLHRDIKPENIIVCDDGRVMLIDFGTAREYAQGQAQGHTIVVTPGYAPLEQYAKQARRGAFTDVYGLAATFYHLLTGQSPPAASDRAVGVQVRPVREENPQISQGVAGAIHAGLEMEIAKRPQSVREFLELMHAPATQSVAAVDFEVALMPHENAMANAQRDALLALSQAPANFFSGANQARQEMLDEALFVPQSVQPIQLAPPIAPQPILPKAAPSSAPLAFSMSPDLDGGVQFQPAPTINDPTKSVYWVLGGMMIALGFMLFVGSGSRNTRSSTYSSSGYSSSWPNYSSAPYRNTSPALPGSITSTTNTVAAAARREMESTPSILPVSVETLPISPGAQTGQSRISTNSAAPNLSLQGLAEFSVDGQLVAYVDSEGIVRVWSLSKRRIVSSLPQSKAHPPSAIRFSPDAKTVVISYQDQGEQKRNDQVTVWDLATEKSLGTLAVDSKNASVNTFAALLGGKVLFTKIGEAGREQLFIWDPRTGKQNAAPIKAMSNAYMADFATNGGQVVTGDRMGHIRWWDARTGVQKAERSTALTYGDFQASPFYPSNIFGTSTQSLSVESVRFSRNGSYLATRNQMQIRVFDSKAQEIGTLPAGYWPEFAVSPDGRFVVGGKGYQNPDQNLLWNVRNGKKIRLQGPSGRLKAWSFSPDGKQIIGLSSSPERVSLVTWRTDAKPLAPFVGPQISSLSLPTSSSRSAKAISLSNRLTAMQTGQRLEIRRFDGSLLNSVEVAESPITRMTFSPEGRFLFGHALKGEIRLWNAQTGQQMAQLEALEPMQDQSPRSYRAYGTQNLIFSPDNSLMARAGSAQGKNLVEVWSLKQTPRRIASLALSQPLTAFIFSADNRSLICGEASGKLRLYDVATQKLVAEIQNGPIPISHLASIEQGVAVVSVTTREKPATFVTLYDMPSIGDTTRLLPSQKRRVPLEKKSQIAIEGIRVGLGSIAISPDGQFAATRLPFVSGSGVSIWNLSTGYLMQVLPFETSTENTFPRPLSSVFALAFSPDSAQLHCISRDMRTGKQQMLSWQCPLRGKLSP